MLTSENTSYAMNETKRVLYSSEPTALISFLLEKSWPSRSLVLFKQRSDFLSQS